MEASVVLFSMTGFGVGHAESSSSRITAEIRSVNSRSLDVRVRTPDQLAVHALLCEQLVRKAVGRGRVEVLLRSSATLEPADLIDRARARQVKEELDALAEELGLRDRCTLEQIVAAPGVMIDRGERADLLPLVEQAVNAALTSLKADRRREGEGMRTELLQRGTAALSLLEAVESAVKDAPVRLRARFLDRLASIAPELDRTRAELEVALLVDRSDVSEELARARMHLSAFIEICSSGPGPVSGRRLDFLLQEILREATTLSAKAQDASVSQKTVEIRVELERLREQVQNVE